jgi:acetyl-CoA C-acetyltransferase
MTNTVIISACRTAIGRFRGGLTTTRAPQLGAIVIKEAIKRAGISPDAVEEVIMGNVISAGLGQNPARQAAHFAGVPDSVGSFTVNKVCGSGLKSVVLATQAIRCGDHEVIVAGGMENMSDAPYVSRTLRGGARMGNTPMVDAMVFDGLWEYYNDFHMGETGELVAEKYNITREMQDEFAYHSHMKAAAATKEGKFRAEIVPVEVPQRKGEPKIVDTDEGFRPDTTIEKMAKLRPAFRKNGTVTAGNASQISDGASALVVMSEEKAKKLGVRPIARIISYATGGMSPEWVMMAPLEAVRKILAQMRVDIDYFDLIELNEAFSVQGIALSRELKVNPEKLNVHGGAVALGHPIGCSGARILTTLIYALKDRGLKKGLAALCLGGGNAVGMAIEML